MWLSNTHTEDNLSYIKDLETLFVQEIDNMENITSLPHLKHINTSTFRFMAKAQGQTLVWTRAFYKGSRLLAAALSFTHTHL